MAAPVASRKGTRAMSVATAEMAETALILSICVVLPMAVRATPNREQKARMIVAVESMDSGSAPDV